MSREGELSDPNAQGGDALMGMRTPRLLTRATREAEGQTAPSLEEIAPEAAAEIARLASRAEQALGEAFALEFTIEAGVVHILDAQPLKATARAAVRIAVELAEAGAITRRQALLRIDPSTLTSHLHPTVSARARRDVFGHGLPASPGAAIGAFPLSLERAGLSWMKTVRA